ncbi:hypothetical protein GUJ93_ZPchr0013g35962 [Zizania palustris]|uniref:RING-type domain-containing protein n=1 Tax=Zizania palustris TaxID=103762 RepID=A0A8J5WYC1_ZIZPA|nr:hypothetical protein GUJ93_ZPchr0013g35962 [Zizania palustris]
MAVEAYHLHRLPAIRAAHQPPASAAVGGAAMDGEAMFSLSQAAACYGGEAVAGGGGAVRGLCTEQMVMQGYQPYLRGGGRGGVVRNPAAVVGMQGQYSQLCGVDAAESGVTFGGGKEAVVAAPASRKRMRDEQPPVLGAAADVVLAAQARQQLVDVDRLVLQHAAKMWAELAEQRRRHARDMVAAVEAEAAKRLNAKDEEIERIGRLNWTLEERLKGLYVEAQVWRDLALSNEATANALRGELQLALDTQAHLGGGHGSAGDDAESCCYGENDVAVRADDGEKEEEEAEAGTSTSAERLGAPRCKGCGEATAIVLLLPCRHLCACAPCAAAARACPACGCAKNGSVCVNFS